MGIRNLKVSNSVNLTGAKEFNHLRIANLDYFLSNYGNNLDYYASPFKIIYELEKAVMFENNPEYGISIPYKSEGDVIFNLVDIKEEEGLRIVTYEFDTFIS